MKNIIVSLLVFLLFALPVFSSETDSNAALEKERLFVILLDESISLGKSGQTYIKSTLEIFSSVLGDAQLIVRKFSNQTVGDYKQSKYSSSQLFDVVDKMSGGGGSTVLYDTIILAENHARSIADANDLDPYIILFSDGFNEDSIMTQKQMIESIRINRVPIVSFPTFGIQQSNSKFFELISKQSGGVTIPYNPNIADLRAYIEKLGGAKIFNIVSDASTAKTKTWRDWTDEIWFYLLVILIVLTVIALVGLLLKKFVFDAKRLHNLSESASEAKFKFSSLFKSNKESQTLKTPEPIFLTEDIHNNQKTEKPRRKESKSKVREIEKSKFRDDLRTKVESNIDDREKMLSDLRKSRAKSKETKLEDLTEERQYNISEQVEVDKHKGGRKKRVRSDAFLPVDFPEPFNPEAFHDTQEQEKLKANLMAVFENIHGGKFALPENSILFNIIHSGAINPRGLVNTFGPATILSFIGQFASILGKVPPDQKEVAIQSMIMLMNAMGLSTEERPESPGWGNYCSEMKKIFRPSEYSHDTALRLAAKCAASMLKTPISFSMHAQKNSEFTQEKTQSFLLGDIMFFSSHYFSQGQKYEIKFDDNPDKFWTATLVRLQTFPSLSFFRYRVKLIN